MKDIAWIDKGEYPFKNNYIHIEGRELHYIDEGSGEVVLFVHGIPDWSFGWRNVIKELSEHFRCIAIDQLGFGLSDKVSDADLGIKGHADRLEMFIERLGLKHINLVVHDIGGPIGLSYAVQQPDNVKSITAMNTWMWPLDEVPHFAKPAKLVNSALGRWLYMQMNFSVRFMLRNSYADKKNLPDNVYKHYLQAQQEKNARLATYTLAKALTGASTHMQYLWSNRNRLDHIPMQIVWGMQDKFVPAALMLPKWERGFEHIRQVHVHNAGHFVQEEAPKELSAAILQLVHDARNAKVLNRA